MKANQELQNYIFISKYARWLPEKNRRETWKEAVDRVRGMMLEKYKDKGIEEEINWAYDYVEKKKGLGSQRMLQFGGKPVTDKHARGFNCTASYIDRLRFFQECFYILLCGAGCGFSTQRHHIEKLPNFSKKRNVENVKKYIIADTIEAWADSIGVLISSYFDVPTDKTFSEYTACKIKFDYSKIRPKGSYLSSSSGRAPGSGPLRECHEQMTKLLDARIQSYNKLRPIDAHDLTCFLADATLSGGVRRASLISLFSDDDEEMLNCKTGNWFIDNPHRGRCNNSVVLLRQETTREKFDSIFKYTREFGEPGIYWVDSKEIVCNPCARLTTKFLTLNGIRNLQDINIGDQVWSSEGWTTITNKWSTGINKVYKYKTTANYFEGTSNHRILQNGEKIEVQFADTIDICNGPEISYEPLIVDIQDIMDGLVIGDGTIHKASNNLMCLVIGDNDQDYFESEIQDLIIKHRPGIADKHYTITTTILPQELPLTYNRCVPDRFLYGNTSKICGFLRGLYSANGSVVDNRITLKSSSFTIIEQVQLMLSSIGIRSYYTTNKSTVVKFNNGDYECKQSYDLNISTDREKFAKLIGFLQTYKNDKLQKVIDKHKSSPNCRKNTYDIIDIEYIGEEETFDITVDNQSHTYWSAGCDISNCNEVGFYAYDPITGNSAWHFCNLGVVNCANLKDEEDFYNRCKAISIICTLQAGFTDFPYLGKATENLVRAESLIGVSLTGMAENTEIAFNPKIQRAGAKVVKKTNEEIAKKLGINPAARCTVEQPNGTGSLVLGCSSGIHPHHAKRYIRRVQNNLMEKPFQFFKTINHHAVEKSVWGKSSEDENLLFPIEVAPGSKTKNQLPALEMLELVKLTQQNWIAGGRVAERCLHEAVSNNVSNTVVVKDEEWSDVMDYLYNNREYLNGVSFISDKGDKDFPQSPFTAVIMSHEIVSQYGNYAVWCSGLIETALETFDGDLWKACDFCLIDEQREEAEQVPAKDKKRAKAAVKKLEFYDKMLKFANKFVKGDLRTLTYCMKDVHNWKLYCEIEENFKPVDYTLMVENEDNTKLEQEVSCSGGACLI